MNRNAGAMVTERDDRGCSECGEVIPPKIDGGLANRWHFPSCSLYDPNRD